MEEDVQTLRAQDDTVHRSPPLLIAPEPYSGVESYTESRDHFENLVPINGLDEESKLLWLRVMLTLRARKTFQWLPETTRVSYSRVSGALKEWFELASRRELYVVEFHTRKKEQGESWADFAEDLQALADRAYPDLQEEAC